MNGDRVIEWKEGENTFLVMVPVGGTECLA